jgi:hypothetical protein
MSLLEKRRVQYSRAGSTVTLVPWSFPISCATLCLSIQLSHTLNKVQYLADGNVSTVSWFQEVMARVRKSIYHQCHTFAKNMCGHFRSCLFWSHPELPTCLSLNRCPFKWRYPVNSPVIILSWFLHKLNNSVGILAAGLLRKFLVCFCSQMD